MEKDHFNSNYAADTGKNIADDERPLTGEEIVMMVQKFRAERKAAAPEYAKRAVDDYIDTEMAFSKQLDRSEERGERHIPQKEFEIWENDLATTWAEITREEQTGEIYSMPDTAIIEDKLTSYRGRQKDGLHSLVEAQAGHFYDERRTALLNAIRESDDDAKETDLQYLREFPQAVMKHLSYKYMSPADIRDSGMAEEYDRLRTSAHNDAIRHLNGMNHLAKKYHTKPFTVRNFWTSDVRNQTPAMSERMSFDRHLVEAYYEIAFDYEIRDMQRKAELEQGYY